jgi:hypothetical protein
MCCVLTIIKKRAWKIQSTFCFDLENKIHNYIKTQSITNGYTKLRYIVMTRALFTLCACSCLLTALLPPLQSVVTSQCIATASSKLIPLSPSLSLTSTIASLSDESLFPFDSLPPYPVLASQRETYTPCHSAGSKRCVGNVWSIWISVVCECSDENVCSEVAGNLVSVTVNLCYYCASVLCL